MIAAILVTMVVGVNPMDDAQMRLEAAARRYEEHSTKYTGGEYKDEVFRYRLLKPKNVEPGKRYPVVLFLHGAGERGDDNRLQLMYLPTWISEEPIRDKYPCFVVVPQCRADKKWVDTDWSAMHSQAAPEPTDQLKAAVQMLDEVVEQYPIDKDRQYLTGISMGGYGSWDLAMRQPDRFAAVVPICGGGDASKAEHYVNIPIWAFHGDQDEAVRVERSRNMIEAIRKAGGHPKYTEYAGVGHRSWDPAYQDPATLQWMFQQQRGDH